MSMEHMTLDEKARLLILDLRYTNNLPLTEDEIEEYLRLAHKLRNPGEEK